MSPRCVVGVGLGVALCGFAAAAGAVDFAEVELVGSSVSRSDSGPPVFGYDPPASPDLVSSSDTATPLGPHADHEDSVFARERLYRSAERVNADRNRGSLGTARGDIEPGHSIAVMSGWADAGSNALGGAAEAHAGLLGSSNGGASSAMRIEKRITILPGSSGLEPGTLVTGLRWEFDGHGLLEVGGMTHPSTGGGSAGCDLGVLVLRGPTGQCGAFDCPHGALAVAVQLETGFEFQAADPAATSGLTGIVDRSRSWSASYNAGAYKAGGVFESGGDHVDVGQPITDEDVWVTRVEAVDTGGEPLGLASIEFEANVGETLRVELDLHVGGAVGGASYGRAEFFDSFGGRAVDPLARGLIFESSVPVPEAPRPALLLIAMFALAAGARRSAALRRGVTEECLPSPGAPSPRLRAQGRASSRGITPTTLRPVPAPWWPKDAELRELSRPWRKSSRGSLAARVRPRRLPRSGRRVSVRGSKPPRGRPSGGGLRAAPSKPPQTT